MAPLKYLGPDGFKASFFQKHQRLVGEDVYRAFLNTLHGVGMDPSLHSIFIALIAKKCKPQFVNDFRPISLYNVTYKLISKVIVNTLKPSMDLIISCSQIAFIPRRIFTDNILIPHELLHTMKHNMKGKRAKWPSNWTYLKLTTELSSLIQCRQ